ncbi:MAG: SPOR domain-containing protein [Moraxellaceae bacterium]|nr:SPOR domain-containing protein [Moraxellaceae bacterium]
MEKAVKQRLLGGLVLVAGAALLLPVLLDGSGAELVLPPAPPAPVVPAVQAPVLDAELQAAEQAVAGAPDETAFLSVTPPDASSAVAEDVMPDAAAGFAGPDTPVPADAASTAAVAEASRQAALKVAQEKLASEKAAADKLAADKATAAKAQAEKMALDKTATDKAAAAKAATEKAAALEKERLLKLADAAKARAEAEKKAAAASATSSAVTTTPATTQPASAAASDLPQAWVVQVASLSARDKADALVQKLRQKGYRAMVTGQAGAWKVLVGPELSKPVADAVRQRLAADAELALSGWVQPWKP